MRRGALGRLECHRRVIDAIHCEQRFAAVDRAQRLAQLQLVGIDLGHQLGAVSQRQLRIGHELGQLGRFGSGLARAAQFLLRGARVAEVQRHLRQQQTRRHVLRVALESILELDDGTGIVAARHFGTGALDAAVGGDEQVAARQRHDHDQDQSNGSHVSFPLTPTLGRNSSSARRAAAQSGTHGMRIA